jgi:ferritin-like metal-binding protein YciE
MPTKTKKPAPKVSSKTNRPQRATATAQKTQKDTPQQSENGNDSRLEEFFHDELKDIYWAEKHLLKVLPKMAKAATATELKDAFTKHLEVTQGHVQRLEQVFEIIGQKPQAKKCEAMAGITKEGDEIIADTEKGTSTRDVGLIFAGQKVEHYEIATYGGLTQLAKTLGYNDAADILNTTLSEEKEADQGLSGIAENTVNQQAEEE